MVTFKRPSTLFYFQLKLFNHGIKLRKQEAQDIPSSFTSNHCWWKPFTRGLDGGCFQFWVNVDWHHQKHQFTDTRAIGDWVSTYDHHQRHQFADTRAIGYCVEYMVTTKGINSLTLEQIGDCVECMTTTKGIDSQTLEQLVLCRGWTMRQSCERLAYDDWTFRQNTSRWDQNLEEATRHQSDLPHHLGPSKDQKARWIIGWC